MNGNLARFEVEVEQDAVIADPSAPRGWRPFEAFEIAFERIGFHGNQRCFNALLIF